MSPSIRIQPGGLDDPRVVELLRHHVVTARAEAPPCSAHALDVGGLKAPEISFWSIWRGETLVGVGAWKRISPDHGEVKSMHVVQAGRGGGVGATILRHIMADAKAKGVARLSLETGVSDYFKPAVALYRRHGFVECPPFADYAPDPNSIFMTCDLAESA